MSAPGRTALLARDHAALSIRRQCVLLGVARSSVYRVPRPANDSPRAGGDLVLMRRLDELFTAWPFLGSRRLTIMLRAEGHPAEGHPRAKEASPAVNRKRVQLRAKKASPALMRQMGIAALGPKPRTTVRAPGHKIFPYLLRDLALARPGDRAAKPGLGERHHLHPDRAWLSLSGGGDRLGEPGRLGVAAVEHDGRVVLRIGDRGSAGPVRQAGDLQHRSRQPPRA